MNRTPTAVAVVLVFAVLATPALAHTYHLEVDSQVSADGSVALEWGAVPVQGYLVVRRNDGGDLGEPIGHIVFGPEDSYRFDVSVPVDDAVWDDWRGARLVWIAFHREGGGEGFDPAADPLQRGPAGPIAEPVSLTRGDRPVRILNDQSGAYRLDAPRLTLREVAAAGPRRVVVRAVTENGTDPVIGTASVGDGISRDVVVALNDSVFATRGRSLVLNATLATDAGPVTVGGDPVATRFRVYRVGELNVSTSNGSSTAATPLATTTEPLLVTPSATGTMASRTGTKTATSGEGPGFGALRTLAVVAAVAAYLAVATRRS